ncbi:hypothetical protein TraAM80_04037 [Trypanosoma rangeli]|uniref:MORN repeat-containing protein n=1 Tax=Trypanosoma rangeli TaxID=5698 RepID=A0A3R7MPX2_TRYRA|nr:uncharacterized protein TraAM80_04037 [Trypanosoma rangeli]RNF06340.1 hypothetical protein TraAM80_04037 [Trypanosoma rangeli]|eukprot:RNF06340.1 hypothetical protein TraAM80_04037 [Trypanosoma rangeli]
MSLPTTPAQPQPADVTFESHQNGKQRVVMCPIEFGSSSTIQPRQLEKHAGFGFKLQRLRQKHLYTGDVVRAGSTRDCGNSSNVFIPHGVGTLVCLLYVKGGAGSLTGKAVAPVGLPHTLVVSEFGEVEQLRDAVLLTFSMYTGSFSYGRRQGKGRLTVYPHYFIDCCWDDDAPLLDRTPCVLCFYPTASTSPEAAKELVEPTYVGGTSGKDADMSRTMQYIGMISLISSELTPHRGSFAGLAWAEQARFVPDGVGEMLYPQGNRYCGFWQCGQRHGFGVEYDSHKGTVYMGSFVDDHREGSGTLHYCATGVMFSGSWKRGELTDNSNTILPTYPFILQGTLWKSYEKWSFDYGTLMRAPVYLGGIWEPLFLTLDEKLASHLWEQQATSRAIAMTVVEHDEAKDDADESFIVLLNNMMQSAEFKALLVPFQRCYYFLYKPCVGRRHGKRNGHASLKAAAAGHSRSQGPCFGPSVSTCGSAPVTHSLLLTTFDEERHSRSIPDCGLHSQWASLRLSQHQKLAATSVQRLSPLLLHLRELGHNRRHGVAAAPAGACWSCPSWCDEMGVSGGEDGDGRNGGNWRGRGGAVYCFHTESVAEGLATRMSPAKLFEHAMHDLASFVSSVRLRLLSYVASHPSACDVSVSKRVLAVCWDSVYALVAPVIHELAAAAEAETVVATSLAVQRCASLNRQDFIPTAAANKFGSSDEERETAERITRLFGSPAHHSQRVVEQTTNGQLLCFGPHDGSGGDAPDLYFSPASMFAAFRSVYTYAVGLFPCNAFLQERWMSYSVLEAFIHAGGAHPRDALSPPAVLRILQFLATEVNPRYPFTDGAGEVRGDASIPHEEQEKSPQASRRNIMSGSGGFVPAGGMETDMTEVEFWLNSIAASYAAPKEATEVLSLLALARSGVTRLQSVYPTIRFKYCPSVAVDVTVLERGRSGIVYPLDELAVRTRFLLLAAAALLQRHCQPCEKGKARDWCVRNSGSKTAMQAEANTANAARKVLGLTQWLLRLPVAVMRQALQQVEEPFDDVLPAHEDSLAHAAEQRREPETLLRVSPSEVLLWIVECIGGMLESPNFPSATPSSMAPRQTSVQTQPLRRQPPEAPPSTLATRERHMDSAVPEGVIPTASLREGTVAIQEAGNGTGAQCLEFQWKHFIPINGTFSTRSGILPLGDTEDNCAGASALAAAATSELLSEGENLHISLLQGLLADVGVGMRLHMQRCYDTEEDVSSAALTQRTVSPAGEKTGRCCVGKEAVLSLHVRLSFLGSRVWEVLADAWLEASIRLRGNAATLQHMRRKGNFTDAVQHAQ